MPRLCLTGLYRRYRTRVLIKFSLSSKITYLIEMFIDLFEAFLIILPLLVTLGAEIFVCDVIGI